MFVFSSYSSSPHPVQFVHFHIAPSSSSTISKLVNFFLYFHLSSSSTSQSVVCGLQNPIYFWRQEALIHSAEASQESFEAFHKALKLSHISLKLSISMGFSNSTGAHRHSKKIRRHHCWLDQHGPQHQHYQQHQRLDQHQNLPQHQR